jgi:dipeptidyl aminopeptidase/acylaminoacyl peptidase
MAADTHPFSVHDMLAMDRISDAVVSPDGAQVLFSRRTTDLEANKGRTDLWTMNVDGSNLRQLTTDAAGDWNGRWASDGRSIWFLSSRSGSAQVWNLPLQGGEARQITEISLGVGNLVIAPDGKKLAFTVEVFPGSTIEETQKKLDEIEAQKTSGRIYDQLIFRHWDTWKDGRRSHLFVMKVGSSSPVDVMKAWDVDVPAKPFGGAEEFTFTPDSNGFVFSARKEEGSKEAWSTNFDLYRVGIDGEKAPQNLTADNLAWDTQPVFSPDGSTMAWLAMKVPGYEADRFRIRLMDWKTGKQRTLTADWDRSPGGIAWAPDGKSIYASASNLGQRSLFAIDAKNGKAKTVVEQGTVTSFDFAGDRIVYGLDHLQSPVELYSCRTDGGDSKRLTHINDAKVAATRMGNAEQFTFKGWNDETVHAYVMTPADFDEAAVKKGKKYPVAFLIHGGPQGSFGNHFHYRWNPQAYAGAGYATVFVDFHGSTGYGQDFCDSIGGDWGGKPFEDLQKGLAAALKKYEWLDGDRVSALGASFGGYMINWIAGNWPDRFRALVNHDGNLDERMAYYDTEELWFPERDHGGTPWENPEGYEKHNPINHVSKWKTPMLVIHGALDYRVVDTQGMSTFTALQRLGIPSRFLYFPDENHWVLQPANSIQWHDTVIEWLDRWTK